MKKKHQEPKPSAETRSARVEGLRRRAFLGRLGLGAAGVLGVAGAANAEVGPLIGLERKQMARRIRKGCAKIAANRPHPVHPDNGEESDYPYVANYSKGLPHDDLGEVDPAAYEALVRALSTGREEDFEAIPLAGTRKLTNPQAGLGFDLEGPDGHSLSIPPAPRIDSPENSGEMVELYWQALTRDVHFSDYESDALALAAADDLSRLSDFRGPKDDGGRVTPRTLFRGTARGETDGPYISQFLYRDIPYGTLTISQRQRTAVAGLDYMTAYRNWLKIQRGATPSRSDQFEALPLYIRNGRDLATYVHFDALYEAYLNAALILLGLGAPADPGNPYGRYRKTAPFGTFGGPHILSLVTEVATRALKAVWFQKWYVHRRLRPEAFGGRVHNHLTGARSYPIDSEVLNSDAVSRVRSRHGSFLLPMAFPEGSPTHPAYGAGHATVAGACTTILKAWFDEDHVLEAPVAASADGTDLVAYTGPGAERLTLGGELNKLASNVAIGRNAAGVHWRTDASASLRLGEEIAIGVLEEQRVTLAEPHSFTLTRFDGTRVTV